VVHGAGPGEPGWDFSRVMPTLTQHAVRYLHERKHRDRPFFLMFSATSPHTPVVPEKRFQGSSACGYYGDYVSQLDDEVGRLLAALEESGQAASTVVICTSDNGPERYCYDLIPEYGHRSAGPLRGVKRDLYEGGHRIPLIVRWPGVAPPGRVSDVLVSQVDLMATCAAVAGVELPPDTAHDSFNQLPVFQGGKKGPRRSIVHNTHLGLYAVREDNWILIAVESGWHAPAPPWYYQWEAENGYAADSHPGELYDLSRDLPQKHNLYGERPGKVKDLTALLDRIRARGQVR
jgi:arylsulfatase A